MVAGIQSGGTYTINFQTVPNQMKAALEEFVSSFKDLKSLTDEDIKQINSDFLKAYDETLNSDFFRPDTKEQFQGAIEALYKRTVCGTKLYNPDYPGLDEFDMDLMPVDIDLEFDKYLKSKGCENEEELQVLNDTPYRTKQQLVMVAQHKLLGQIHGFYDDCDIGYAMSDSEKIIGEVDIKTLSKYIMADEYESYKMAQGFIRDYSGGEINCRKLLALQKELDEYMKIFEKQNEEKQKHENSSEKISSVDYSKYDEKYGGKYEARLALNYEEV